MLCLFVFHTIVHRQNEPTGLQKPDIRSTPGKVKSGSPKKPLMTSSPRVPKTQQKVSPRRKNITKEKSTQKRKYYSSSDSESDISIKLDDDDCDLSDDDGRDLDLDEYIERLKNREKAQQAKVSDENLNMQNLNVQLETLPIYIRSADTEDIKIELIDHLNPSSSANGTKRRVKAVQAKVMPLPDLGFQYNDDETVPIENTNEHLELSTAPMAILTKTTINEDDTFKKPNVINHKLKAKTLHYEPQPSTSKETMEIVKKSNNFTKNLKKKCPEKAMQCHNNTDTPAKVTNSLSKDKSPEEDTDTLARVTRSQSKNMSPESNPIDPKVKSKVTLFTSNEIVPGNENSSPKHFQKANTDNVLNQEVLERDREKNRAKNKDDDCIIQLPEDTPRNRKPQLSSTTPIHVGDGDMIEKFLPIRGRTRRILWNKQDPEVGKSFRGTSYTISVETINSIDSMTTMFHEPDDNIDYEVNNKSPNAKELTDKNLHNLNFTTGDTSNVKSNVSTQKGLSDLHAATIDEHHNDSNANSNKNSEISLPDLNCTAVHKSNSKGNEEREISTLCLSSTSIKVDNIKAHTETQMTLPDVNCTADKNNIEGNAKTKTSLPALHFTPVEHHQNINNKTGNEKTVINMSDLKSTTLEKHRKAKEDITMGLPDLKHSTVDKRKRKAEKRKETTLPDLNSAISTPSENMPTKRLVETPNNTQVPVKKPKTSKSSEQEINSCGTINTPDCNKKKTRHVSSDKVADMPNLDPMEDTVRITRSSKTSPETKGTVSDILDESVPISYKFIKIPEKRQQKQILRKSKFKRMGIIEIADLDTDRTN